MARSRNIDFSDRAAAERWFRQQPREVAIAMAARAALRVLPTIIRARQRQDFPNAVVLPVFRAAAIAWAVAEQPDQRERLRAAATAATAAATATAAYAGYAAAAAAAAAAATATAAYAAADAADVDADANADAAFIGAGRGAEDRTARALEMASKPLWLGNASEASLDAWGRLKSALIAAGDDWDVWTAWYEERLAGRPANPDLELARVELPDDLWRQGPASVNARIKQLIAEHAALASVREEGLPAQTPRAAVFQPDQTGAMDVAPISLRDRLADTDDVRDFYDEAQEKLDDLIAAGRNMLGSRLAHAAERLRSRMPDVMLDAVERLVWSGGNTLRSILAAHDAVATNRDPHPDKLDPGATERLRDFVGTFNQLAIADPSLLQRDAARPGPQEHQRTLTEISLLIEAVEEAANNRNLTTPQAGEQLLENAAIARDAGSCLTDRLAVELARDTNRNLAAGMVVSVYRTLRRLPMLTRGDGGFISKEYFSGFYKYAGGATAATLVAAIPALYHIRWDIIEFIVVNADQFKLYGAYAFEQSPGFKQMIDWLEAHVSLDTKK